MASEYKKWIKIANDLGYAELRAFVKDRQEEAKGEWSKIEEAEKEAKKMDEGKFCSEQEARKFLADQEAMKFEAEQEAKKQEMAERTLLTEQEAKNRKWLKESS